MMPFIDLKKQYNIIKEDIDRAIQMVLDHGQYIMGPEVKTLEQKLASFTGVEHCITCSSGTDALLMVLLTLGIKPGDAVFTTPFTFIATAEVIKLVGATPIFVDIDPDTWNINIKKLETSINTVKADGALTPKAIIPVDIFGLPCDYTQIEDIAETHGLWVLEDAAQSFGGKIGNRMTGSFGHAAATSFFPAKPLGCYGDGGAIFTNDDQLCQQLISVRNHGTGSKQYTHDTVGVNGRLDSIQAAVLIEKLKVFPEEINNRQLVSSQYLKQLQEKFQLQTIPNEYQSAWAQFSILAADNEERTAIRTRLKENGIPTTVYYPIPLHQQEVFNTQQTLPVAEDISSRIFSVPMHPYLSEEDIKHICGAVNGE